ncbi:MAG: peptidase [Epulopiscium sp. Nuni2H_MBin003]|nr:MAG: peptidase [Epulopiscium sp. Nuni2H_MBin003]
MIFYDSTYILIILGAIITLAAQAKLTSTFSKYSTIRNARGLTGKEVAEQILRSQGLYDVTVRYVPGNLSDHYDPSSKTVNLSDATYNKTSIAAVGVAAHECGHALQHDENYVPLQMRTLIVPVARFGSMAAVPLIILGMFLSGTTSQLIIQLGIIAFLGAVIFQVVTLPVEYNASNRAVDILESSGILSSSEIPATKTVLNAAALTYVAAVAASLLQLLRLVLITSNRNE